MKKAIRKYACRFILEFFAVFGITAILMVIYAIVTGGFIESFWGTCLLTVLSVALLILLSLGGELYKTTPARCIWQIHRDETGALRLFDLFHARKLLFLGANGNEVVLAVASALKFYVLANALNFLLLFLIAFFKGCALGFHL